MTDEEGVEERYQPTKFNLVRPFRYFRLVSAHPNDSFLQRREIKALGRGVQPGDRRVFYCMNLPPLDPQSPMLMLLPTISCWSFRPDALLDG